VLKLELWFVNVAVGASFATIVKLKLSVVVVPKVFVNVIVESKVSPL